jgi:hypothetical protein
MNDLYIIFGRVDEYTIIPTDVIKDTLLFEIYLN